MRRFVFAFAALAILASPCSIAADSYLFVENGRAITNGAPVNVKALKAKYIGSYFWFSISGKSYIVRDSNVLSGMKPIYAPLFDMGIDFTFGEQLTLLSEQMTVLKEQLRIGLEPKPGEDAKTATRRLQLKQEQNRLAARQNELAARANASAARVNDYASRLDDINRGIERQLHDLATQLVAQRIAVEVGR